MAPLFLQVTKHGTYIDGFAGPQVVEDLDGWSAGRVIRGQPGPEKFRLQHFHLFDTDPRKAPILQELADSRPDLDICVHRRDFNAEVASLLRPEVIGPKEATFCLLDQHTSECRWSTLQALAAYKNPKIELFYFLAEGWLNRALANTTVNQADLTAWWGGERWQSLPGMSGRVRADLLAERFRSELGYTVVEAVLAGRFLLLSSPLCCPSSRGFCATRDWPWRSPSPRKLLASSAR